MDSKEQKNSNSIKRNYLVQKHDSILEHCFSLCTDKGKPGSSLSNKQITCVGIILHYYRKLWNQNPQCLLIYV